MAEQDPVATEESGPEFLQAIANWSEERIDDEAFLAALGPAEAEIQAHRAGIEEVVASLTETQQEACTELLDFAFQLINVIEAELNDIAQSVEKGDRNRVFIAGDQLARASIQLNKTLINFRHQALLSLGPTQIPTLNQLIALKEDYMGESSEERKAVFLEGINAERIVTYESWGSLGKEPDLTEVNTLAEAFKRHMANLNALYEAVEAEGASTDFEPLFASLGLSFNEVATMVPVVSMALRAQGETELPDINFLLNLTRDAEVGNIGDEPVAEAVEALEMQFQKTREDLEAAAKGMDSALARDEIESCLKSFEHFEEGIDAVYKFMEERDRLWLVEARGYLIDFGKAFTKHQDALREIEEQQNKVMCPRCSGYSERDSNVCSKCGAALPKNVAATETTTFQSEEGQNLYDDGDGLLVTANLEKLYEAVNAIHQQTISDEEFLEEVAKFEGLVDTNAQQLPAEPQTNDEEKAAAVGKIYDALEEGIESMREGLELFRQFLGERDENCLKLGVEAVDRGAKKVYAVGEATASVGG